MNSTQKDEHEQKSLHRILPYFEVHDIVLEINNKTLWIFAVNPAHKLDPEFRGYKNIYLGMFRDPLAEQKFVICAFNDGTTVISHQINPSPTYASFNVIIKCDIPSHLLSSVLSTKQYTNVTVSILTPRHFPHKYGGVEFEYVDTNKKLYNLNRNISDAIIDCVQTVVTKNSYIQNCKV